jgi:hypothetical protein
VKAWAGQRDGAKGGEELDPAWPEPLTFTGASMPRRLIRFCSRRNVESPWNLRDAQIIFEGYQYDS